MNPKTSLQGCLFPRFFLKAISVFVVATFLCSDLLAFPSQSSSQSGSLTSPQGGYDTSLLASASATSGKAQELVIPPELGKIDEISFANRRAEGGGRRAQQITLSSIPHPPSDFVFLIQDAHSIPDAQRSLEKLVEHLQGQYGVATVALEGAEGKLDPTLFKMFPDAEKRAAVFGGLIGSGELSGAAMASVLSPYKADYVGIENWGLYQEGVAAFLSGLEKQPEVNAQCATLNEELRRLKAKYYSSEAKEFDARLAAWNTDPSQLAGFLEYLSKFSRGNAQSARLNVLFETLKSEKIRDPKLEAEVKKFARYAHEVAPSAKLNGLVQSYKTGSLTLAALAYEISKLLGGQAPFSRGLAHFSKKNVPVPLLKPKKEPDPLSPSLQALITNHEMLVNMKGPEFSKELDSFLAKAGSTLFTSPGAQETARLSRRLDLLGKLIRFELTREEWNEIGATRNAQRATNSDEIMKFQNDLSSLEDVLAKDDFFRFYEIALKREAVFLSRVKGLLSLEDRSALRVARCAVVTGGFHTDGLAAKLKEQRISYAVITPAIQSIPKDTRYLDQMQGHVSWAKYFRPRNGRIDLYDAFARATTERLLADSGLYAKRSTLSAKEWRDDIIRGLAAQGRVAEHAKYTRYIDQRAAERFPEFQSLKTTWTAKLEKFIERLQALGKNGQITEANIAKLLAQPANQTPYAVASVVPGSMGFDPTEKLKTPEMVMVTSAKRSEVRGDENSRESEIAAHLVRRSFTQYCKRYESLGARAQQRFEDADWTGSQQDVVEDDKTYHASINEAAKAVESGFPDKVTDPAFWDEVRYRFYIGFKQKEVGKDLAKVFFESVKRSAFKQQEEKQKGEQKEGRKVFAEYLDESLDKDWLPRREVHGPMKIDLEKGQRLGDAIKKAMQNYKFRAHMDDLYGNSILAGALLSSEFKKKFPQGGVRGAEFLDVPLFRNKEAYIFGRVFGRLTGQELSLPFIVCLAHSPKGIAIDAVLTEQSDISEVLTTTRSNLFGDLKHYHQILAFLRAYFPVRAKPSLFKIIGFNHVAKVQLLYELRERLRREKAKFVRAAGIEGKVMVVFNLPGYPYVMKVVRDETPKEGVRDADYVIGKYRKVREMDRVGRMMDYIGLHGVSFPQEAFDKDLLNELLRESSKEVRLEHGRVYFQHIFVQGKLIPLDIFTQSPLYSEAEKRQAILDYGKCILEVAQAGLFAGDVLIKNYGVSLLTGLPRVFSYDYDDLDGLLNWNFMLTPPPRNEDEEMMADDDRVMFRYTDVVVDQLERYMAPAQYRALFREHYGRFFTPEFWKDIQDKVRNGVFFESRSYPEKRRLSEIKKNIFLKWDASSEIGAGAPLDQESVSPVGPGNGQSKEASLPPMIKPQDLKFKFLSELSESERQSAKLLSYFQRARDEVGFWKDWNTDFWGDSNTDAILVSYKGEFVGAIAFIKRPDGSVLGNGGFVDPRLRGTGVGVVLRENLLRRLKDEKWAFFIIGGEESSVPITENTHHFRKSLEGRPGVSVFKDPNGFIRQVRVTLSRFEPLSKTQRKKLLMNLMIEKTIAKDPLVAGPAPEREGPQQQQRSEIRSAQTFGPESTEIPLRVSVVIGATLGNDLLTNQLRHYLEAPKSSKIHKQVMIAVDARSRELHPERFEILRKLVESVDPKMSGLKVQIVADPGVRGTSEAVKNGIAASTGEAVILADERAPLSDEVFKSLVAPLARGRSEVAYDASGLYTVVKARILKEVKLNGRTFPINDEIHAKLKRLAYPSEIVSSLATEKVQPRSFWESLLTAVADRVYSLLPVGNYYRGQYEFEKSMEAMAKLPRLPEGERKKVSVVIASRSGKRLFSPEEEGEGQDALRIKVVEQLQPLFALNPSYDWELVIVDDATPGGKTGKRILKKAEALFPDYVKSGKIRVVFSTETKSQKGGGILLGMKDALAHRADYVVYTDVDLSADLRLIGSLLERIIAGGSGIVIGSRDHPRSRVVGRGIFRDISSAFYHALVCSMLPLRKIFDTQSGCKAFSREAALAIVPEVKDIAMSFDTELLVLGQEKGFAIEEVPIYWKDSQVGTSISILMQMFRMTEGLLGQRMRMLQRRLLQSGNSVITDLSILLTRVALVGVRAAQQWLRSYLDTKKWIANLSFFKPRGTPEVSSLQEAKLEEQTVKDLSSIARSIVGEAGRKLADYRKRLSDVAIKTKLEPGTDNATLVTEADEAIQRFIIAEIQKLFPGHFVIAEEKIEDEVLRKNHENQGSDFVWVLDPIDGTKEFLKPESDFYAISLSLFYKGQPVLAVVQSPYAGVIESSADRSGVYWNGKAVRVNDVSDRKELHAVIDDAAQEVLPSITVIEDGWKSVAHGTRSVVLNLARIALSGDDTEAPALFWKGGDRGPALWDIAGSSYLLKKAGGVALCIEDGVVLDAQEAVSRAILDTSKRAKHFSILAGTPAAMSGAASAMEKVLSRGMADSTKSEDLVVEKATLPEKIDAIRAHYALEIPENAVAHPIGHAVKPQQPILVESQQGTFVLKRIGDSLERARFVVSYQRQLNQKGILAVPRLVPLQGRSGEAADDFLLKLSDGYYTLEEGLFEGAEIGYRDARSKQFEAVGGLIATLQNATEGFTPEGEKNEEPLIGVLKRQKDFESLGTVLRIKDRVTGGKALARGQKLFIENLPMLLSQMEILKADLPEARYAALPKALVPMDVSFHNMRFSGDGKTPLSVYDFGKLRYQARLEDLKNPAMSVGPEKGRTYDRAALEAIVRGYQAAVRTPLTAEELAVLPEFIRGTFLWQYAGWFFLEMSRLNTDDALYRQARDLFADLRTFAEDFPAGRSFAPGTSRSESRVAEWQAPIREPQDWIMIMAEVVYKAFRSFGWNGAANFLVEKVGPKFLRPEGWPELPARTGDALKDFWSVFYTVESLRHIAMDIPGGKIHYPVEGPEDTLSWRGWIDHETLREGQGLALADQQSVVSVKAWRLGQVLEGKDPEESDAEVWELLGKFYEAVEHTVDFIPGFFISTEQHIQEVRRKHLDWAFGFMGPLQRLKKANLSNWFVRKLLIDSPQAFSNAVVLRAAQRRILELLPVFRADAGRIIDQVAETRMDRLLETWGKDVVVPPPPSKQQALSKVMARVGALKGRSVVLIGGTSASGKTELVSQLKREWGHRMVVMPLDDYFKSRTEMVRHADGTILYDHPDSSRLDLAEKHIRDLLAGETIELPSYDMKTGIFNEHSGRKFQLAPEDILVVESIHALHPKVVSAVGKAPALKLFMKTPAPIRLLRRLKRDTERGYSYEATLKFWPYLNELERTFINPTRRTAEAVLFSYDREEAHAVEGELRRLLNEELRRQQNAPEFVASVQGALDSLSEAEEVFPLGQQLISVGHIEMEKFEIERNPLTTEVIAIDGPMGTGKDAAAKALAKKRGSLFLHPGIFYSALAEKALSQGITFHDRTKIEQLLADTRFYVWLNDGKFSIYRDGAEVTDKVWDPEVSRFAALLGKYWKVHQSIFQTVRRIGEKYNLVVYGGNCARIFSDTRTKLYLKARMDQRIFRKQKEYQPRGLEFSAKEIWDILESRDALDQQRLIEPVAQAPDAEAINTSDLSTDEIVELMEEAIQRQQNRLRSETRTTGPMLGGGILEQDWPETRRVFRFLNGYNIHERPSGVLADLASKISGKLKLYVFLKKGDLGPVMLSSPYQVRNLNICYDQDVEILVKGEEPDDIRQDVAELVERAMQDGAMLEEEDRDNPRYASYLEELDRIWVKALAETGHVLTPDQEPKTWGERLAVGFKGFSLGAIVALPNAVAQGARQLLSGKSSTDAAGGFQGVQFYYQNEPVAGSASIQKAVAQLMASKQQFVFNAFVSEDNALTFGAFPRKYKRPGDDTEVRAAHSDIPRPKREFGVLECVLFYSEGAPMLILEPNHTGQPPLKQDFQKAFSDLVRLSRFMIASGFPGDLSLDTGTQSDIQTLFTEGFNQKMSVLPSTLRALSEEGIPETENVGAARSEMRGGREEVAATPAEPLYEHKPSSSAYEAYFDNILQIFREISYGTVEAFDVLADLLENQKKTEAKRRQRYGEDGRFFKDESRVYAPLQAILGHLDREPFAQNMELIAEFLLRLDDPWLFRWALSILHSNSIAPVQERPNALIAKRLLETVKEMAWGIAAPSYRVSVAALRELEEAPLSNPFYRILAEVYKNSKFKPASDEKIFFHGKRSRDERYMNTAQARKKAVEQMRKKELDEEMEQVLGRRGGREEVAEAPADFGGGGSALVEDEMTARSESRKEKEQPIFLSHDAEDEDSPVTQALILIETKIQDIQSILRELMKPAIPSTERVALDEILQSLQVMTNGFYNLSLSQENESRPGERQQYLKGVVEAWKETGRRFYAYSKSQTSEEGLSRVRQIKDLLDMVADYASGMVHMRIRRPARSLEDAVQTLVKADDLADYAGELVAAINRARKTKGEDPVSLATLTQNPEKFEADFFAPMYRLFSMKLQTDFKNAEPFIEEAQRIVASQGVFGLREALSRKEGPLLDLFKKIRHNGADRFISIDLYGQCIFFLTDNFEDYFGHIYDELIQTRPAIAIGRKFVSYHARAASTIDFREKMLLLGEDNPADPYRQDRDVSIFQKPALDQRNSAHAAKLRKAIEIWKARAAELGSEEMTRRIEHFEKAMTWVKEFSNKREGDEGSQDLAGQLPLIIADAELNTIRVVHADRMEHAMYFSAAYLESLDIHDPEDMKELAIWLNVSQKWLDLAPVSEPRTAENGRWDLTSLMSPAQRQDLDVEELRRDINDRFFEQEDTQLISSDRLKARMAALERQHVINRYQTFMDKVIQKEEFVAQKIREGKRLIRELPEHPEWDPSSKVRDPFRDAANACKELLLRYEAMGMRAQADRVFRLVLYMTSFVQFYDKGGLLPWSFQEDLIFIALRLGYWGHFLNEVSIYLKAREASVPGVHESVLEGFWRSGFPRAFEDNNVLEIENYRWRPGNWFFFRKLQSVMQSQLKASLPELFPERNRIVGEVYRLIKEAKEDPLGDLKKELGAAETTGKRSEMRDDPEDSAKPFGTKLVVPDGSVSYDLENAKEHPKDPKEVEKPWWIAAGASGYSRYQSWWNMFRSLLHVYETEFGRLPKYADARVKLERWHGVYAKDLLEIARLKTQKLRGKIELIRQKLEAGDDAAVRKNSWGLRSVRWLRSEPELETMVNLAEQVNRLANESVPRNKEKIQEKLGKLEERLALAESLLKFLKTYHEAYYQNRLAHSKWPHVLAREQAFEDSLASFPEASDAMKLLFFQFVYFSREKDSAAVAWLSKVIMATFAKKDPDQMMLALNEPERIPASVEKLAPLPILNALIRCLDIKADPKWSLSPQVPQGVSPFEFYFGLGANLSGRKGKDLLMERLRSLEAFHDIQWPLNGNETRIYEQIERIVADGYDFRLLVDPVTHVLTGVDKMESSANVPWRQQSRRRSEIRMNFITPGDTWAGRNDGTLRWGLGVLKQLGFDYASGPQKIGVVGVGIIPFDVQTAVNWVKAERGVESLPSDVRVIGFELPQAVPYAYIHVSDKAEGFNDLAAEILRRYAISRGDIKDIILSVRADKEMGSIVLRRDHRSADGTTYKTIAVAPDQTFVVTGEQTEEERYRNTDLFNAVRNWMGKERFRHFVESKEDREEGGIRIEFDPHDKFCKKWGAEFIPTEDLPSTEQRDLTLLTAFNVLLHMDPKEEAEFIARAETVLKDGRTDAEGKVIEPGGVLLVSDLVDNGMVDLGDFGVLYSRPESEERCFMKVNGRLTRISGFDPEYIDFWGRSRLNGLWLRGGDANPLLTYDPPDFHPWKPGVPVRSESREPISNLVGGRSGGEAEQKGPLVDQLPVRFDLREQSLEQTRAMHPELTRGNELFVLEARFGEFVPVLEDIAMDLAMSGPLAVTSLEHMKIQGIVQRSLDYFKKHGIAPVRMDILHALAAAIRKHDYKAKKHDALAEGSSKADQQLQRSVAKSQPYYQRIRTILDARAQYPGLPFEERDVKRLSASLKAQPYLTFPQKSELKAIFNRCYRVMVKTLGESAPDVRVPALPAGRRSESREDIERFVLEDAVPEEDRDSVFNELMALDGAIMRKELEHTSLWNLMWKPESIRDDDIRRALAGWNSAVQYWIAREPVSGRIAGILILEHTKTGEARVKCLLVHPDFWESGVGTQLMTAAFDAARKLGEKELRLETLAANSRARKFYRNLPSRIDGITVSEHHTGGDGWFARREPAYMYIYTLLPRSVPTPSVAVELDAPVPVLPADTRSESRTTVAQILFPGERLPGKLAEARIDLRNRFGEFLPALKSIADIIEGPKAGQSAGSFEKKYAAAGFIRRSISIHETNPNAAMEDERLDKLVRIIWNYASRQRINATEKAQARAVAQAKLTDAQRRKILGEKSQPYFEKIRQVLAEVKPGSALRKKIGGRTPEDRLFGEAEIGRLSALLAFDKSYLNTKDMAEVDNLVFRFETWRAARPEVREPISNLRGGIWVGAEQKGAPAHELEAGPLKASSFTSANEVESVYKGVLNSVLKQESASAETVRGLTKEIMTSGLPKVEDRLWDTLNNVFVPTAFAAISETGTLAPAYEALDRALRDQKMDAKELEVFAEQVFDGQLKLMAESIQKGEMSGMAPVIYYSPEMKPRLLKFIEIVQQGFDAVGDETGKQYQITLVSEDRAALQGFKTELSRRRMLRGVKFVGENGPDQIAGELMSSVIRHPVYGSKFGVFFPSTSVASGITAWQRVVYPEVPKEYAMVLLPALTRYFASFTTDDLNEETFATTLRQAVPDLFASARFQVGQGIVIVAESLQHLVTAARQVAASA